MTKTIPILLYHSVRDDAPGEFGPYAVSRPQFASHLDRLVDGGYFTPNIGTLLDLIDRGQPIPERTAVITFDDGFDDFSTNAWPELKSRNQDATLYVTSGTIGGRAAWLDPLGAGGLRMLSEKELLDVAADGCEIGAHSMTHPQLDCVSRAVAAVEIKQSKDVLEQMMSTRIDSFAYPHGYHDKAVKQLVVDAGYTSAAAVRDALSYTDDDRFALARVTVLSDFSADRVDEVLNGQGFSRAPRGEQLRTRGWRQVRRWRHAREARDTDRMSA